MAPADVRLWINLSHALLREGKAWERAEEAMRKVLELEPDNAEARHNLALLLQQQGRAI